MSYQSADL